MATTAYGSITIVDFTDVGQFSVVPFSDAGLTMIYDPNALGEKYSPTSLNLTPIAYYGGKDVSSGYNVVYRWYKRTNGAPFIPGTSDTGNNDGGIVANSINVTKDDFNSVKVITYYVKAIYDVDNTTVTAYGQITLSCIKQASQIQDIEISGDNIFKYVYSNYGSSATIVGNSSLVLTADYTSNVAVHAWYYHEETSWISLSGVTGVTISGNTCTIAHTAPIFTNDKARIKVTAHRTDATGTELTDVFDEYSLLKLYDGQPGAPGTKNVAMILSNEDQTIPFVKNESILIPDLSLASTTVKIFEGSGLKTDITLWTSGTNYTNKLSVETNNCTGGWDSDWDGTNQTQVYTVSKWTDTSKDTATVTFYLNKGTSTEIKKMMSLTKLTAAADGKSPTVYSLSVTPDRVTTNSSGATTSAITLTATVTATTEQTSKDVTQSEEDIIYYEWYKDDSLISDENSYTYTVTNGTSVNNITCKIRKTNSSGTLLDSQSVAFIAVGAKGNTGATGDGAIVLNFPQDTDTIGLKSNGTIDKRYELTMPFTVYQGSTALAGCSVSYSSEDGYSFSINGVTKGLTITSDNSKITLVIDADTKLYDSANNNHALNGECTIPIKYTANKTNAAGIVNTVNGIVLGKFSWNLNVAPVDGSSVTIDAKNSWTRYKVTSEATQPTIEKTDSSTVAAAIGSATKPYYLWSRVHTEYLPSGSSDAYSVTYAPVDPKDGESVITSDVVTYAYSTSGTSAPTASADWKTDIATAVNGKIKPYYVWTKKVTSYKYSNGSSAGSDATTYSTSYYPADKIDVTLTATAAAFTGNISTITLTPIASVNSSAHTLATSEVTWAYVVNGVKTEIISTSNSNNIYKNGTNLIVKKDAVNGATTIECKIIIGGQSFYEYLNLDDYTDEFRCELVSTLGDKITNGIGSGKVYCRLFRNGTEINKMASLPEIITDRNASINQKAVFGPITYEGLEKPNDISTITYSWTYQQPNANGVLENIINNGSYNTDGKIIYIDGSMITNKIVINCTANITYK